MAPELRRADRLTAGPGIQGCTANPAPSWRGVPTPAGPAGRTSPRWTRAVAQRRKTLRAALVGWTGGADTAATVLYAAGVPAGARGESLTIEQFAPTIASTCDRHWRMTSATDRGPPPPGRCLRASRQRSTCARGWPAAAGRRPRAEHRLPRFGRPARSWPRMRRTSTGWRTSRRAWGLPDGAGQR